MLKIAFIGLTNSFDFNHIGGASALIRRIAIKLAEMGDRVDFVQYGTNENAQSDIRNNIKQKNCRTFTDLLDQIKENYDHIVSVYIKPVDRISFICFRKDSESNLRNKPRNTLKNLE